MTFIQHIKKLQGTGNQRRAKTYNEASGSFDRKKNYVFTKRDKETCRVCNNKAYNVHHILPRRDYKHWEKEISNMISLCRECHNKADNNEIDIHTLFGFI